MAGLTSPRLLPSTRRLLSSAPRWKRLCVKATST